ncbi:MAG: tyrosine-type recombinase/integrase [Aeromonas veronii]
MSKTKKTALTDAAIKRHAEDLEISQISEPVTGLVFRYSKRSRERGSIHLRHYQGGVERWLFVARYPEVTTKQAKEIRRQMKPVLFVSPDAPAVVDRFSTVGQCLDWHCDRVQRNAQLTKSRKEAVASAVRRHLKPLLGDVALSDISHTLIDEKLFQPLSGNSPSFARSVFGVLKTALKMGAIFKLLTSDPMRNYSYKDFNTARVKPKTPKLTQKELKAVIGAMPYSGRTRLLIQLMLLWGTRIGETVAMRWSWVDWDNQVMRLPPEVTKTSNPHDIPITPQVRALLLAHKRTQSGRYAFIFPGRPQRHLDVSTLHKEIAKVSGGEWTSHDLRKLARTIWGDLGVEYAIAESLLNHTISGLDVIYNASQLLTKKREALTMHTDHLSQSGLFV